jgi:hypothetical protein
MNTLKSAEYKRRFKLAEYTERWAVTMTKVAIRQAVAQAPFPRWHFLSFSGPDGGESRGVVDLIAIRKDHGTPRNGTKRGDIFQIVLIQVKGGYAAKPTPDDGRRLRVVARYHRAHKILLATWRKGKAVKCFSLHRHGSKADEWRKVDDLATVFG